MQNRYDWTCYTIRIKKKSFLISLLVHTIFSLSFFLPITKNKEFKREIFVVKMVSLPEIEIPKVSDRLEEKVENFIKKQEKIENINEKPKIIKKNFSTSNKFSPEDYKQKLYSNILKETKTFQKDSLTKSVDIKIPEINSEKLNLNTISFSTEVPVWYMNLIKKKIEDNWLIKEYFSNLSTIVSFRIYRSGKIENIIIEKSSGDRKFDNSIIDAIKSVKVWPEFPENVKDKYFDIIIEFKMEG
ncbi:MAG: TonB family protein [Candidatus Omnitrophica bacterium]|nr:TonB family protein [Candidatus Omnitrophota bacterium]